MYLVLTAHLCPRGANEQRQRIIACMRPDQGRHQGHKSERNELRKEQAEQTELGSQLAYMPKESKRAQLLGRVARPCTSLETFVAILLRPYAAAGYFCFYIHAMVTTLMM